MTHLRHAALGVGLAVVMTCAPIAATAAVLPQTVVASAEKNILKQTAEQIVVPRLAPGASGVATIRLTQVLVNNASGLMTFSAPGGTTFGSARVSAEVNDAPATLTGTLSSDKKTLTVPWTGDFATLDLSVTLTSARDNGRAGLVESGRWSGGDPFWKVPLSTSFGYVAVPPVAAQPSVPGGAPSVRPGASWSPTFRVTNESAGETAAGAAFAVTAPSGAVFRSAATTVRVAGGRATEVVGTLASDRKTLTVEVKDAVPQGASLELTVDLQSESSNTRSGLIEDGSFTILAGPAFVTGATTRFGYTSDAPAVTVAQVSTPTLQPGKTGDIVVRYTNQRAVATAVGTRFDLVAPEGTTFARNSFALIQDTYPSGWTVTGTLSADKRTLSVDLPRHQLFAGGWGQITVAVTADPDNTRIGSFADGQFRVTGGGALPAGTSLPLRYVAEAAPIVAVDIIAPPLGAEVAPGNVVFAGTGHPGATVTVRGRFGTVLGTGVVSAKGEWAIESTISLVEGAYSGSVTQTINGNTSSTAFAFTVVRDARLVLKSPARDAQLAPGAPVFSGAGLPGATVTIRGQFGTVLGTVVVNAQGTWAVASTISLPAGTYAGTVTQNLNGTVSSVPFSFVIR